MEQHVLERRRKQRDRVTIAEGNQTTPSVARGTFSVASEIR